MQLHAVLFLELPVADDIGMDTFENMVDFIVLVLGLFDNVLFLEVRQRDNMFLGQHLDYFLSSQYYLVVLKFLEFFEYHQSVLLLVASFEYIDEGVFLLIVRLEQSHGIGNVVVLGTVLGEMHDRVADEAGQFDLRSVKLNLYLRLQGVEFLEVLLESRVFEIVLKVVEPDEENRGEVVRSDRAGEQRAREELDLPEVVSFLALIQLHSRF